jgi:hypothetical protein
MLADDDNKPAFYQLGSGRSPYKGAILVGFFGMLRKDYNLTAKVIS